MTEGLRFGPYLVDGTLGSGGMGVVYEATHSVTGERAAVKAVRMPHAWMLGNLRREIQALATLDHPGIIRIVAEGMEEGMPWYAMPLVAGRSLSRRRSGETHQPTERSDALAGPAAELRPATGEEPRDHPRRDGAPGAAAPDLATALTLVRRLCDPLRYLHGEGFVHRDLKPMNVLVDAEGWPVIIDFGLISRVAGAASRDPTEVAALGSGTVGYMAPEVLHGDIVDARADLYALGCILFELVTGKPPFDALEGLALAGQHLTLAPPRPSDVVPGLPPELDALVGQLLAKRPGDRLGYADDVGRALARLGADDAPWPRPRPPRLYLYRPLLSGRSRELALLETALDACMRGRPGIVLLHGESGVGKTRLLAELARKAGSRGAEVVLGDCPPQDGAPLQGFLALLRHVADRCREEGEDETRRLLGPAARLLAEYEPSLAELPGVAALPGVVALPVAQARQRILDAVAGVVARLAARGPLLLGLDDTQWADELTFAALEHLQRLAGQEPLALLVVVASRQEEPRAELDQLAERGASSVALGRVGESEVGAIVKDMLALREVPGAFARFLSRESQGNPLFAAEYLRTAVEAGLLARDAAGAWRLPEGAEEEEPSLPLPRSLQELVASHVDQLDDESRHVVEAAAVLGRNVRLDLLATVAERPAPALARPLLELRRRHMLEPDGEHASFGHDKVREVVYARLPAGRRAAMHRHAATALETLPEEERQLAAGALGTHWEAAGDGAAARPYYLAAALAALREYALASAESFFLRYLALGGEAAGGGEDAESTEARRRLAADVYTVVGRSSDAEAELLRCLARARELGDRRLEGRSMLSLGNVLRRTGRFLEAKATLEAALGLARGAGLRGIEASALSSLTVIQCEHGELEEAEANALRVLAIHHETRELGSEGSAWAALANVQILQGRMDEALAGYERALAIDRAAGDRRGEGNTLGNVAAIHLRQGRVEAAVDCYERALAIHQQTGAREFEGITIGNLANVYNETGRYAEAVASYDHAIAIHRAMGHRWHVAQWLANRAVVDMRQSRLQDARTAFEEAIAIAGQVGDRSSEGIARGNLGLVLCEEGRLEESQAELSRCVALHRESGDRFSLANGLAGVARLHLAAGDASSARSACEEGIALARELGDPRMEAVMTGSLASCLAATGDLGGALERFEQALVGERECGERLYEGIHRAAMARVVLQAGGDPAHAGDLLRRGELLLHDAGNAIELARLRCVRGHLELALAAGDVRRRQSADALLAGAREVAAQAGAGPRSPLGRDMSTLAAALAALEAGRPTPGGFPREGDTSDPRGGELPAPQEEGRATT